MTAREHRSRTGPEDGSPGRYLVIGATGGLGRVITSRLRGEGATVVELDRPEVDLRRTGVLARAVERVWNDEGPLRGLVHAAGLYPAVPALETTEQLFDDLLAVNARSALVAGATVARLAIEAGEPASVVFVSSVAAVRPQLGTVAYSASKAALEAIVRGLALETGPSGIRVNAVAPGFIRVDSTLNAVPERYVAELEAIAPRGRVATPDDVVPSVLWLLSSASDWVNGQTLVVDGGANLGSVQGPHWL